MSDDKTPKARVVLDADGWTITVGDVETKATNSEGLATQLACWMQECLETRQRLAGAVHLKEFYKGQATDSEHLEAMDIIKRAAKHLGSGDELRQRLTEALTPSADTKAAYSGEFKFPLACSDESGAEYDESINVPWTTIKEIMAAILKRAEQAGKDGEA